MDKQNKRIAIAIIQLVFLFLESLIFPLGLVFVYCFLLIPRYGFSFWNFIPFVFEVVFFVFLGWSYVRTPIMKCFNYIFTEIIKKMENDNGQANYKK